MTDEERQKLCDILRHLPAYISEAGIEAADKIGAACSEEWEWQDPPSWINGPTKVRAGNAVTAKALKDFK